MVACNSSRSRLKAQDKEYIGKMKLLIGRRANSSPTMPKSKKVLKNVKAGKAGRNGALKAKSSKNRVLKSQAPKRAVAVDDLGWKPVDVPDTIDDFEGFYGLEEIEGVGVEKKEGGNIVFTTVGQKKAEQDDADNQEHDSGANAGDGQDEEMKEVTDEVEETTTVQKSKKGKKSKSKPQIDIPASDFSALENVSVEEEDVPDHWQMGLQHPIRKAIDKLGFTSPTDIQKEAIPAIMAGDDVIGKASTGSGKTLAYGIPILQQYTDAVLADGEKSWPTGIIFGPTRELVHQICDHLKKVSQFINFETYGSSGIVPLTGGLAIEKQQRLLAKRPAIVVATPGRFLELFQSSTDIADMFKKSEILVLDEADRLLQTGHYEELDKILELLTDSRQKLVFSATFQSELMSKLAGRNIRRNSDAIAALKKKLLLKKDAKFIDVNPAEAVAREVVQSIIECGAMEKDLYLYYFLLRYPGRSMVFVNSIDAVKRIAPLLKELSLPAFGLHSHMVQKQRLRSLEKFKESDRGILIATDVAARGLDIPLVQHVVHYHLPRSADMYVHRSGRTARAGNEGVSVVLCSPQEVKPLNKLRQVAHSELRILEVEYDLLNPLKERVKVAKQIADSQLDNTRGKSNWLKEAADDLGADLDELEEDNGKKNSKLSKNDTKQLKARLRELLAQPVGKRSRYMTGGNNLAHIMVSGQGHEAFVGKDSTTVLGKLKRK